MIGKTLAHYEITALLGKGGMGEVYRAKDTKLGREVALKLLPPELSRDPERLARLEREARTLASIHHPRVASLFGLEEAEASTFLVMELVEGPDLSQRLESGKLPREEAIELARMIAEGLEEAHRLGVVHRDLKPANIKITHGGELKILDFGLARAFTAEQDAQDLANSPTITAAMTQAGVILGTAAYMSPEQAKGKAIDSRSDVWSFGVILYELLAGQKLFQGETVSETMAGVINGNIELDRLPKDTPLWLRALLERCLDRDPNTRLQSIGEARIALASERMSEDSNVQGSGALTRTAPSPAVLALALVAALIGGIALDRLLLRPGSPEPATTFQAELEVSSPDETNFVSGLAISPDGSKLAFVARGTDGQNWLWVRELASNEASQLPGTVDAIYPFWSPDSQHIGFFAQGRLKTIGLLGGQPRAIADTGPASEVRGGAWSADDRIIFAPTYFGQIFSMSASGGEAVLATEIGENEDIGTQRFPNFLPDGKRFVFFASRGTGVEPGYLYLGRLDSPATKLLGPANSTAVYAEPGYLIYVQGEALVAHRFDEQGEVLSGQPASLGISMPGNVNVSGQRSLSISRNGILVYRVDKQSANEIIWVDREGNQLSTVAGDLNAGYFWPTLSPDGRRMIVSQYEPGTSGGSIWVYDIERGLSTPKTSDLGDDTIAIWSHDGSEIAYSTAREQSGGIYRIADIDGATPRPWMISDSMVFPSAWLAQGPRIIYTQVESAGRTNLWIRDVENTQDPRRLGAENVNESNADVSRDGEWLAFQSDVNGRLEIYLRRVDDESGISTLRVSSDGGINPRWRADGAELFYVELSGNLMSVPMESLDPLRPGAPKRLFQAGLEGAPYRQYDVSLDGQQFLLNRIVISRRTSVTVVMGWEERLR